MQLHQRGVDVLLKVMDAADHIDQFNANQTQALLREVAEVMSAILERDARLILNENDPTHI
ncbi:GTPase involved in cell partitioning and DNA repair [Aquamicrobium ahrensii]|uniref:GTPase involved in cell partitioning and DNA repair n=1 Tax=Aquamicrobium ahrensii TaxID=469551 RepID=A0ABV2KI59_9HYPH